MNNKSKLHLRLVDAINTQKWWVVALYSSLAAITSIWLFGLLTLTLTKAI